MTPEEFLIVSPQFKQKTADAIAYTLSIAQISCPTYKWGTLQPTAIGLFAAHILTANYGQLAVTASTAGAVAAGNQVSFPSIPSNATENDSFLMLSVYGMQLKQLKEQLPELARLGQLGEEVTDYYATILGNTGFAF